MKPRRFRVLPLSGKMPGDFVDLPAEEFKHLRVLRLNPGDVVELFDDAGGCAQGILANDADGRLTVRIESLREAEKRGAEVILAVAWPKGKRSAILVEKCTELGVGCIVPLRSERSIVSKEFGSEGLSRLARIAAEAAKQSRRADVTKILPEESLHTLIAGFAADALAVLMDPQAPLSFAEFLIQKREALQQRPLLILIGPEGGFSPDEAALAATRAAPVRLAGNILRVETAAIAACAIAQQFSIQRSL